MSRGRVPEGPEGKSTSVLSQALHRQDYFLAISKRSSVFPFQVLSVSLPSPDRSRFCLVSEIKHSWPYPEEKTLCVANYLLTSWMLSIFFTSFAIFNKLSLFPPWGGEGGSQLWPPWALSHTFQSLSPAFYGLLDLSGVMPCHPLLAETLNMINCFNVSELCQEKQKAIQGTTLFQIPCITWLSQRESSLPITLLLPFSMSSEVPHKGRSICD